MKRLLLIFSLIAVLLQQRVAVAQSSDVDCLEILNNAQNEFLAGRFYGVPAILKDCIDNNRYSREQLVQVYLLLTQVYLLTDDPIGAENSYLKLLQANPEYVSTELNDPIDVFFLSKKFTTTPIFTPHFKGGLNESRQYLLRDNGPYGNKSTVRRTLQSKLGWTVGAGIEWNIDDNWGVGGELFLSYKSYGSTYRGIFVSDSLVVRENQFWADVPLYVRYADSKGRVRPYAYMGHTLNFMLRSNLEANFFDKGLSSEEGQVPVSGEALDVTFNRRLFNRSFIVGGGVKVKTGRDFIVFDLRLVGGLTNLSKGSYYNSNASDAVSEALTRYGYLSDDFRLNNLVLTFGYVRPLYDPRKVKNTRSRFISRKMKKSGNEDN